MVQKYGSHHMVQHGKHDFHAKGTAIIELLPYRCQRLRVFFESMSALNLKYISIEPTDASNVMVCTIRQTKILILTISMYMIKLHLQDL